jgi:SAM-dependent methyltransferase
MATYLCDHPEVVRGKSVVELGAGPALPGVVAARLGAERVVLTDLPTELELPATNAEANGVAGVATAAACPWGDAAAAETLGTFDVVICSDVLYGHRADVARALAVTMRALCKDPGGDGGRGEGGGGAVGVLSAREARGGRGVLRRRGRAVRGSDAEGGRGGRVERRGAVVLRVSTEEAGGRGGMRAAREETDASR